MSYADVIFPSWSVIIYAFLVTSIPFWTSMVSSAVAGWILPKIDVLDSVFVGFPVGIATVVVMIWALFTWENLGGRGNL